VVGLIGFYLGAYVELFGSRPSLQTGQTIAFLVVGFTSIVRIFTVRTRKSIFKRTLSDNWPLAISALAMCVSFALMVLIAPVGAIFGMVPICWQYWLIVIGLSVVPTIVAEAFKAWDNARERREYGRRLVRHEMTNDTAYV